MSLVRVPKYGVMKLSFFFPSTLLLLQPIVSMVVEFQDLEKVDLNVAYNDEHSSYRSRTNIIREI